jgi:hypothetical protein
MDDAQLQTVFQHRKWGWQPSHLSEPLASLMKYNLGPKARRLSALAEIWDRVIPADLAAHTALEGITRGVLRVTVDSSAHRFQLRLLLDGGLTRVIREQFSGPLNKINLVPGRIGAVDDAGAMRYEA